MKIASVPKLFLFNFLAISLFSSPSAFAFGGKPSSPSGNGSSAAVVLEAPSALLASGISSTEIHLQWLAATTNKGSISYYEVYRGSALVATSAGGVTAFTSGGLSPSTSYQFRVRAVHSTGLKSSFSNAATASTQAPQNPLPSQGSAGVTPRPSVPADAIVIYPGDSIQAKVNAAPPGAAFLLKAGLYRMQTVNPKAGNKFFGEAGTILNGARVLTNFSREGSFYVASGQTQQGQVHLGAECVDSWPGCQYPEDLFFDDRFLAHVRRLSDVGPGKWYFDYANDKMYFYDNPAGHRVEASVSRAAFEPTAENVTIVGITVEKYANPPQMGAIGDQYPSAGWNVLYNEVRWNHGPGIRLGSNSKGIRNFVHHNGHIGIGSSGSNVIWQENEVSYNTTGGFNWGWEGGGSKFAESKGLKVRCNYVHHNYGPGLWTDISNENVLYEFNLVNDNQSMGIFHEISYEAVIRNNTVKNNAKYDHVWLYGSQILSSTSSNVQIYNNKVEVSAVGGNGIGVLQQSRGNGPRGPYVSSNNQVHDNSITFLGNGGETGAVADFNGNAFFQANQQFNFNHYHVSNVNQARFDWLNSVRTFSDIRSRGQEVSSTIDSNLSTDNTPAAIPFCPQ